MGVTASFTFAGHTFDNVDVINPGGWFGKSWLIEIGGSYSPFWLVVEADSVSDAIDELSDSRFGFHIHVDDEDMGDYPEEDRHYAGNDGRVVDLDHIMVHGDEGYRHQSHTPYPMRYHGEGLGADGLTPIEYDAHQYDSVTD